MTDKDEFDENSANVQTDLAHAQQVVFAMEVRDLEHARKHNDLPALKHLEGSNFEYIRDQASSALFEIEHRVDKQRHREQIAAATRSARTANWIAGVALIVALLALFRDRLGL